MSRQFDYLVHVLVSSISSSVGFRVSRETEMNQGKIQFSFSQIRSKISLKDTRSLFHLINYPFSRLGMTRHTSEKDDPSEPFATSCKILPTYFKDAPEATFLNSLVLPLHLLSIHTLGLIKLFIAAMAYYINALDSQSSGRGRCESWGPFLKNMYLTVEGLKLYLDFFM